MRERECGGERRGLAEGVGTALSGLSQKCRVAVELPLQGVKCSFKKLTPCTLPRPRNPSTGWFRVSVTRVSAGSGILYQGFCADDPPSSR